jgi:MFS family permease
MQPVSPITDWGTAIITSLSLALAMIVGAVPRIIGFLIILIIGWIIAGIIGGIVTAVLRAVRFNDVSSRAGFTGFVRNMGIKNDPASVLADVAKWFIRLIVLVVAFDALGLPAVSQIFGQILAWLPNLAVALVVLIIGGLIANVVGDLVRGSTATAGLGSPNFLSTLARVLVMGFAIVVAVNQIGIASTLINTLFMAFVGALALAFAIAFGLGGRETAAQVWQDLYTRSREAAPKMQAAARTATASATATSPSMAREHPMRRAADRGEPEMRGSHPMRRSTDMVTP